MLNTNIKNQYFTFLCYKNIFNNDTSYASKNFIIKEDDARWIFLLNIVYSSVNRLEFCYDIEFMVDIL